MNALLLFAAAVGAAVVALSVARPVIALCRRLGLLDEPVWRSLHAGVAIRSGGIIVLVAAVGGGCVGLFAGGTTRYAPLWVVVPALLAAVGLADDRWNLPALPRLIVQVLSGVAVAWFVRHEFRWAICAVLCAFVVFAVNAYNFMDGVDGIASLLGSVAAFGGAISSFRADARTEAVLFAALAGALIAFFPINRRRPPVFLGDVGSYGIASLLATLSVAALAQGANAALLLNGWAVIAVDVISTLMIRVARGSDLRQGHCDHAYQRLVRCGFSHSKVSAIYGLTSAALVGFTVVVTINDTALRSTLSSLCALAVAAALVAWARRTSRSVAISDSKVGPK